MSDHSWMCESVRGKLISVEGREFESEILLAGHTSPYTIQQKPQH